MVALSSSDLERARQCFVPSTAFDPKYCSCNPPAETVNRVFCHLFPALSSP